MHSNFFASSLRPDVVILSVYSTPIRSDALSDGFLLISRGMFPMVMYTGYACLLENCVNWVLSVEMMTGTIV